LGTYKLFSVSAQPRQDLEMVEGTWPGVQLGGALDLIPS